MSVKLKDADLVARVRNARDPNKYLAAVRATEAVMRAKHAYEGACSKLEKAETAMSDVIGGMGSDLSSACAQVSADHAELERVNKENDRRYAVVERMLKAMKPTKDNTNFLWLNADRDRVECVLRRGKRCPDGGELQFTGGHYDKRPLVMPEEWWQNVPMQEPVKLKGDLDGDLFRLVSNDRVSGFIASAIEWHKAAVEHKEAKKEYHNALAMAAKCGSVVIEMQNVYANELAAAEQEQEKRDADRLAKAKAARDAADAEIARLSKE